MAKTGQVKDKGKWRGEEKCFLTCCGISRFPTLCGCSRKNDELEQLLYQAIVELAYVQESPDHSLCARAKQKEIVDRGMKLLGVEDLSRSGNCANIRRAATPAA